MFVSPVSHLGLTVFMQLLFGFKSLADNWSVHTQLDEAGYSHWLGVSDPPPPSPFLKWDRRGEALTMDWPVKKRKQREDQCSLMGGI